MAIDIHSLTESAVYTIYDMYKTIEKDLEAKDELLDNDLAKLVNCKENLKTIEDYTTAKRAEGLRWSLVSLFQSKGMNPTLILEFYPGSDSYIKYGKTIVANVEYTDADLKHIFENMRDGAPRVISQLNFQLVPAFTPDQLSTADIFTIQ